MRIIATAVIVLISAITANAADLLKDTPDYTSAAEIKWSGAYASLLGGYDFNDIDVITDYEIDNSNPDLDGAMGRLALGYDVQLGQWVVGSRVYYGASSGDEVVDAENVTLSHERHYGVNARVGRTFGSQDRFLGFVTIGYQWRDFDLDGEAVEEDAVDSSANTGAATAGGGVEYAVGDSGDIRIGVEYEHMFKDHENVGDEIRGNSSSDSVLGSLSWRF